MSGETPQQRLDRAVRRQHGAFTRTQASSFGFTPRMIERRLTTGAWIRLDASVYAIPSHPSTWERQAMAATLVVEGSALSGRSAAALHGIDGFRRGGFEITIPRGRKVATKLARVRRSDFTQISKVDDIPCLTIAHTILSLAGRSSRSEIDAAVDDALVRRLVDLEELQDRFAAWAPHRRPGVGVLRQVLQSKGGGFVPPTSQLERRFRTFLSTPGLPAFEYEYELPWSPPGQGRVDAYSSELSLIVEADGRAWHTREQNMVNDLRRDNLATANGHGTLRFTWVDLTRYPGENLAVLRQTAAVRAGLPPSKAS